MKQNAGFVAALALLVIVGGVIAYLMMEDQKTPASAPHSETRVFTDDLKGLTAASLTRIGEDPIRLVRTAPPPASGAGIGEWKIEGPGKYRVDAMMLGEWLGALRTLEAERVLTPPASDSPEFGFSSPMLSIELNESGKAQTLTIGALNPEGSARYAKLSGVNRLYLLAVGVVSTLNKSLGDLRQKRALDTTEFAIESIRIETPGSARVIVRTPERDWTFAEPPAFRADQSLLGEFVSALLNARAEPAVLNQTPLPMDRFRSMSPVAVVEATTSDGVLRAEFRKDKSGAIYASSDELGGIYPVQTDLENFLKKPIEEFRNLKLFSFGFSDVFKLRYHSASRTLNLEHPNDDWRSGDKTVQAASVNKLLDELRGLSGASFLTGEAPGSVSVTIEIETAGGAKDHVEFRQSGAELFAVRVGEAGYYKVSEGVLAEIEKAASEIADSIKSP
ncbi:MAG: DUF4340 domain-containing protein [Bryobacterales bacterium]|nr:DUF4340 domain-containing protein [Bryobacterales bacterium]